MSNFDLAALLSPTRRAGDMTASIGATSLASVVTAQNQAAPVVASRSWDARCEVLRFQSVEDVTGGVSEQWILAGAYECSLEAMPNGDESGAQGLGVQSEVLYLVHLPASADVSPSDRLGVPGWFNAWKPDTSYMEGARVIPRGSKPMWFYECVESGAGTSLEPDWPTQVGAQVRADGALWRCAGRCSFLEVVSVPDAAPSAGELVLRCKDVSN